MNSHPHILGVPTTNFELKLYSRCAQHLGCGCGLGIGQWEKLAYYFSLVSPKTVYRRCPKLSLIYTGHRTFWRHASPPRVDTEGVDWTFSEVPHGRFFFRFIFQKSSSQILPSGPQREVSPSGYARRWDCESSTELVGKILYTFHG